MNNESETSGRQSYKISTSSTLRSRLPWINSLETAGPTLSACYAYFSVRLP